MQIELKYNDTFLLTKFRLWNRLKCIALQAIMDERENNSIELGTECDILNVLWAEILILPNPSDNNIHDIVVIRDAKHIQRIYLHATAFSVTIGKPFKSRTVSTDFIFCNNKAACPKTGGYC